MEGVSSSLRVCLAASPTRYVGPTHYCGGRRSASTMRTYNCSRTDADSPSGALASCARDSTYASLTLFGYVIRMPSVHTGPRLGIVQHLQIGRAPDGAQHGLRAGSEAHPGQHSQSWTHLYQVRHSRSVPLSCVPVALLPIRRIMSLSRYFTVPGARASFRTRLSAEYWPAT